MDEFYSILQLTPKGTLILWGVSIFIFFIFLLVLMSRISKSIQAASANKARINQYLAAVPSDRIGTINAVYQNSRLNLTGAMLLCIVGGIFGFQRIYIGKRRSAMAMFLFFWTGIPTVISLFDLTDMPRVVTEFNLSVVESLYNQIAAPQIDR